MRRSKVYSIRFYLKNGSYSTWMCDKKPYIPKTEEGVMIFYNNRKKHIVDKDESYSIFVDDGNNLFEIYNHERSNHDA